jgi:hypothetical protein
MLPGDTLVGKIFREGLDRASAVIVVLSRQSIVKPWVCEELDAAVVKRINEGSKLIPIVLDNLDPATEVPAPIRHLLFENVPNPQDLDRIVDRVVRSVFGRVERPPLGAPPAYTAELAALIPSLDRIDSLVVRSLGDEAIRDFGTNFRTQEFLGTITNEIHISEAQAIDSLNVLDNVNIIKIHRTFGAGVGGMSRFQLTRFGLDTYLRAYEPEYSTIQSTVIARLAGWPSDQGDERTLTELVGAPRLVVDHVLDQLAARNLIRIVRTLGGATGARFHAISPRLRRLAEQ